MTAIVTKRLLLAPSNGNLRDIATQVSWLNNPTIVQYSEQRHKHHNTSSQCQYIESFAHPNLFRVIILNGEMIGTITAHVDARNKVADIGILVGDTMKWGLGFGTEAWTGLMDHLFSTGIRKVEAGCMEINKSMLKVFTKAGMENEGYRRAHFMAEDWICGMELWGRVNG